MAAPKTKATPARRDPTLREMRATLSRVYCERQNTGSGSTRELLDRVYDHMAWLLDAFLFDVDDWADDGGRVSP